MNPDRFRGLARSSPWRWRTVEYRLQWTLRARLVQSLHVWVQRPDALRVESADGRVLSAGRSAPRAASASVIATSVSRGGRTDDEPDLAPPSAQPVFDADGLLARRPWNSMADDPLFENYYFVALLDPLELAGGDDGAPGTEIVSPHVVEHRGRAAWEAVVRPTPAYFPRCSCCALLPCERSDQLSGFGPRDDDPSFAYPDRFVARLDEQTGICVFVEAIGGTRAGVQHDAQILAVDEPLEPALFHGRP